MSGSCAVEPREVNVIPTDTLDADPGESEAPNATLPEVRHEDIVVK